MTLGRTMSCQQSLSLGRLDLQHSRYFIIIDIHCISKYAVTMYISHLLDFSSFKTRPGMKIPDIDKRRM